MSSSTKTIGSVRMGYVKREVSIVYNILIKRQVKANPGPMKGGLAPIYGAAGKMPDRGMVQDLLVDFMDNSC